MKEVDVQTQKIDTQLLEKNISKINAINDYLNNKKSSPSPSKINIKKKGKLKSLLKQLKIIYLKRLFN